MLKLMIQGIVVIEHRIYKLGVVDVRMNYLVGWTILWIGTALVYIWFSWELEVWRHELPR